MMKQFLILCGVVVVAFTVNARTIEGSRSEGCCGRAVSEVPGVPATNETKPAVVHTTTSAAPGVEAPKTKREAIWEASEPSNIFVQIRAPTVENQSITETKYLNPSSYGGYSASRNVELISDLISKLKLYPELTLKELLKDLKEYALEEALLEHKAGFGDEHSARQVDCKEKPN